MDHYSLQEILIRYNKGKASAEEMRFLEAYYDYFEGRQEVANNIPDEILMQYRQEVLAQVHNNIDKQAGKATVRRISRYWWAAAILILAIGSGVYYFSDQLSESNAIIGGTGETRGTVEEIVPGTDRAVLTLSDGTQKELSSADNGLQLQSDALLLTTPKGGQYQAVLPDGSKVWLNAASSIKFPSKFNDKERRVEITGEVYFEIAKDASKPFKVYGGGQEIEVLGTSFNINIYDDELVKKTTLLSGKIQVSVGAALVAAQNPTEDATRATTRVAPTNVLKPNEQLQITGINSIKKIIMENGTDAIAWTTGNFHFSNTSLTAVMRQLSRWYGVDVEYNHINLEGKEFTGIISRYDNVSQVLQRLELTGVVHFKIEGKKIIVLP